MVPVLCETETFRDWKGSILSNHGTHKSDEVMPLMVRMMVTFLGVPKRIVHTMCRKQGPKLYLDSNFKPNCALNFVDKLRDVKGLYSNTPESMAAFSFNENACFQALDSTLVSLYNKDCQQVYNLDTN